MIETGVMSYWSLNRKDLIHTFTFSSLCMWVLSFSRLKNIFRDTIFVCDEESKILFLEKLGLEFNSFIKSDYKPENPNIPVCCWAIGKILAYSLIDRPFLHIDGDVFLSDSLSKEFLSSDIVAQSDNSFYGDSLDQSNGYFPSYYKNVPILPPKILIDSLKASHKASCFAIFGGNKIQAIKKACIQSLEIYSHPENIQALINMKWGGAECSPFIEEYVISSYLNNAGINITHLLPNDNISDYAKSINYRHFGGPSKKLQHNKDYFKSRLLNERPDLYKRVKDFCINHEVVID